MTDDRTPDGQAVSQRLAGSSIRIVGASRREALGIAPILRAHGATLVRTVRHADTVAGWGKRPSGLRAARKARRSGRSLLTLEDAFLRSVGIGARARPVGIFADDLGVHFDAHAPSRIEATLAAPRDLPADWMARAKPAIELWRSLSLSKYNRLADAGSNAWRPDGDYCVVVDQVRGDRSIADGGADEATFMRMLDAALAETTGTVVVRTHPAALLPRRTPWAHKRVHLSPEEISLPARSSKRIVFHAEGPARPLLLRASRVYVATSLVGFEARLLGRDVEVFGAPFYAGWGAPGDRLSVSDGLLQRLRTNRSRTRTTKEIFAAAYLGLPLYLDPDTNHACGFEEAAQWIARTREDTSANA